LASFLFLATALRVFVLTRIFVDLKSVFVVVVVVLERFLGILLAGFVVVVV